MKKPLETLKAWGKAYNTHDLTKIKGFYADNIIFESAGVEETAGKHHAEKVAEFDGAIRIHRSLKATKVKGETVHADLSETSDLLAAAGIKEAQYQGVFVIQEGEIQSIHLESKPETGQALQEAFASFREWASREKPEHLDEVMHRDRIVYNAESGEKLLSLMREWRDSKQSRA